MCERAKTRTDINQYHCDTGSLIPVPVSAIYRADTGWYRLDISWEVVLAVILWREMRRRDEVRRKSPSHLSPILSSLSHSLRCVRNKESGLLTLMRIYLGVRWGLGEYTPEVAKRGHRVAGYLPSGRQAGTAVAKPGVSVWRRVRWVSCDERTERDGRERARDSERDIFSSGGMGDDVLGFGASVTGFGNDVREHRSTSRASGLRDAPLLGVTRCLTAKRSCARVTHVVIDTDIRAQPTGHMGSGLTSTLAGSITANSKSALRVRSHSADCAQEAKIAVHGEPVPHISAEARVVHHVLRGPRHFRPGRALAPRPLVL